MQFTMVAIVNGNKIQNKVSLAASSSRCLKLCDAKSSLQLSFMNTTNAISAS